MLTASSSEATQPADAPLPRGAGLASRTFVSLCATQFLGAVNDNMYRWLLIGIGKHYLPGKAPAVLSIGLAAFVLPYLLLAAPAGYLADRFSKRQVIVSCKVAEIIVMALGVLAIWLQTLWGLFAVLFLIGCHSALYAPAKLGSIPEMLRRESISAANGVLGLLTVAASVLGTVAGVALYTLTAPQGVIHLEISAAALIGVAVLGTICSLGIARLPAANTALTFPFRAVQQTWADMKTLAVDRALLRVALGTAFFWALGSLCQMNIDQFAVEGGVLKPNGEPDQTQVVPLLLALVFGVGFGSVLAGLLSRGRVELGILPLGAGGIVVFSMLLYTVEGHLVTAAGFTVMTFWACLWLFLLGISAGMFSVPLDAFLQHRSPRDRRGAILAASNFLTFCGMLLAAGVFALVKRHVDARTVFLLAGVLTVPVFIYVIWLLPQATIRFVVWLLSLTIYRVRIYGRENLPETGGALLVANHPTWLDGILLPLISSRPVRMIAWGPNVTAWWSRSICRLMHVIPIGPGPKSVRAALETARQAVLDGELVCIFAEGTISRDGFLQEFKPGML